MAYPARWHTDQLTPADACFFFDPKPFEIPAEGAFTGRALELEASRESAEETLRPEFTCGRSRTTVTAAGRPAFRFSFLANGKGLLDAGSRVYGYAIDRGEAGTLVIQTTGPRGQRVRRDVVERAVRSLRLFTPAEVRVVAGLPVAVAQTRAAIAETVKSRDYGALAALIPEKGFGYTFGGPFKGGPVAFWRDLERTTPERPSEALTRILQLPYTLNGGVYIWPFAYDKQPGELSGYERRLLGPLARAYVGEDYYGWRAGIRPDGTWIFFVAGD